MSISTAAIILGTLLMASAQNTVNVEPGKQLPQSATFHIGDGATGRDVTIRYQLFVPKDYQASGKKWPLLLFLHGLGECSNDDLNRAKIHGPAKIVDSRPDFPFIVVTPQCPPPTGYDPLGPQKPLSPELLDQVKHAWKADELIQLVDFAISKLNVDPERVYVTGLSMGGYGTWRLAATYPERFAAAVPICGGGEPEKMAKSLTKIPVWAFHGAKDTTVLLSESQNMVDAIHREHGDVKFTVYPEANHNSWDETYNNQAVYDWLLDHRRKAK